MKHPIPPFLALAAVALTLLAACSSRDETPVLTTGWLGTLAGFERVSEEVASRVYVRRSDKEMPSIATIYIEQVTISVAPGSNLAIINPDHIAELRQMLTETIRKAVGVKFRIATERTRDSHMLRAALTNVIVDRTGGFAEITPQSALRFGFGIAALESVIREPGTNARRVATVGRPSDANGSRKTPDSWPDIPKRLTSLADQLADQIAAARDALAATPPKPSGEKR